MAFPSSPAVDDTHTIGPHTWRFNGVGWVRVPVEPFSGNYADLNGLPTLFSGVYADLAGKPTLGTASAANTGDFAAAAHVHAYSTLTGLPTLGSAAAQNTSAFAAAVHTHPTSAITNLDTYLADIASDISALEAATGTGTPIVILTQAAYDLLTPDPDTVYVITD